MNQLQLQLEEQMKRTIESVPDVDKQVLTFIKIFVTHKATTEKEYEIIRSTFRAGYCWHFAHMLKTTFNRGEVCWAAPFGHFVWVDNNIPYDIEGVYVGESFYFIPESYLGDAITDFTQVLDISHNTTKEEIMNIIYRYESDNNLPHQNIKIEKFLK